MPPLSLWKRASGSSRPELEKCSSSPSGPTVQVQNLSKYLHSLILTVILRISDFRCSPFIWQLTTAPATSHMVEKRLVSVFTDISFDELFMLLSGEKFP
ncbi:MAG: hypothetical protein U5N86_00005, partial [Planctomycetota bacterium]|nr:hypothetical protein [Planctomycetota bacterium]